jgi:type I restriction enzyme S subunit
MPLPSLAVQDRIASTLDAAQATEDGLGRALDAKRRLKRALLQQLLTGKRRLHGTESDSWSIVHMSDVAMINQETLSETTPVDREFVYVDLGAVDHGHIEWSPGRVRFDESPSRARRIVAAGDILMATVRPMLLGFARLAELDEDVVASTGFAVIRAKKASDGELIYQSLYSRALLKQVEARLTGSGFPAIGATDVAALRLAWPNNGRTRERIAELLKTLDRELALLDRQLAALRKLKRGLMQELLTGELEIPEPNKSRALSAAGEKKR